MADTSSEEVAITEVGPRDGLQNQPRVLSPAARLRLIRALVAAGLPAIEVGSFVSPRAVPAMAGAAEVLAGLPAGAARYSVLVPNRKGYDLAVAAGATAVALVVATTQSMNRENIRQSTEQAMAGCAEIVAAAAAAGVATLACLATAWECPFEGPVARDVALGLAAEMLAHGADRVALADTIGAAHPGAARSLAREAVAEFGVERVVCHFHDTRGMGLANVAAALESGVRRFDASVGGMGGCPFAPGATGNVATEDVALMLGQMGFATGIDLRKLVEAVDLAAELTGNCEGGHSIRWLRGRIERGEL